MKLGLAVLAALLSTSAAHANPVTLNFTASGYEVPIASTGHNSSSVNTYTVRPGSCPDTTCTWAGSYTSSNLEYKSGGFTITTTLGDPMETLTGVQDSGNPNTLDVTGAPSDVTTTITLVDDNTGSHEFFFITNGVIDGSLAITGFETDNGTLYCDPGYCTVSEIADMPGVGFEGEPFTNFSFDDGNTVSSVPEPSSLALLGTGAIVGALRRRTA